MLAKTLCLPWKTVIIEMALVLWNSRPNTYLKILMYRVSLGWVNFLYSSPYGAVFWICDQNRAVGTSMFWLLLNSTCTVSRLSLLLHHQRPVGWGWAKGCEGTQLGQLSPAGQRVYIMSYSPVKFGGNFSKVAFVQRLSISQMVVLTTSFCITCFFPPLFPQSPTNLSLLSSFLGFVFWFSPSSY